MKYIKELQEKGFEEKFIVDFLLGATNERKLTLNERVYIVTYYRNLEIALAELSNKEKAALPIKNVSDTVKITKCKTFKHSDPYKMEDEITEWLSSNKITIKYTTQSPFKQHNRSQYGDYYTYGTLITIFYEDE